MVVEIKKDDSPEEIDEKLNRILEKGKEDKKIFFEQFFGIISWDEDPVKMQRRWRDEG